MKNDRIDKQGNLEIMGDLILGKKTHFNVNDGLITNGGRWENKKGSNIITPEYILVLGSDLVC